jgi:hypothetical protein
MKMWVCALFSLVLGCAALAAPPALAQEETGDRGIMLDSQTELALGAAVTAFSTQVQGDAEYDRLFGFQAGIGAPFYGDLSGSVGGRVYFSRHSVAPYVGALFSLQNESQEYFYNRHYYHEGGTAALAGPTIGFRFRQWQAPGLGAFVQAEFLEDVRTSGNVFPSLGAGVQWWF